MVNAFQFAGTPVIEFGAGCFKKLPEIISTYGDDVLIVTGASSLKKSGRYDELVSLLQKNSINIYHESVKGEPSPELVDEIADNYRNENVDVVTAIGGGSVIDTGKAAAAVLTKEDSVMNYIEGVGAGRPHDGEKIPLIAVPTTSGTGSEATKNAVLSRVGDDGFKKSLRHDNFIPDLALLDPELTISCPPAVTAASGMDAITQLLGAYVSTEASPLTDSITCRGLQYAFSAVIPVCTDSGHDVEMRAKMAYASLISGIALANAGLGIVHGLASTIGGFFEIPHGVVCGTLMGEAAALTINLLQARDDGEADSYLRKYAQAGILISEDVELTAGFNLKKDKELRDQYCQQLVRKLREWLQQLSIPRLGAYGITEADLDKIADRAGNKNNPVQLNKKQIKELCRSRL